MNGAHLHLLVNHFPLVGLFFSLLVLGLAVIRKNDHFVRIGLLIAVISGALAVPTFLSGEPAEEVLEHRPGFAENLVEEHEEAAEFAIWIVELTAAAAAVGLFLAVRRNSVPQKLLIGIIVLNLLSLVVLARTHNLGGKINHAELRE